ncbi:hypothetical protein SOVF_210110 isoform A [Spinacia oleracea]|uniref:U1-type domain-containing protein n=1 Tax=Spinacia oleracea TaxID=3562 RepID=A0A9R0JW63_SPIOL|nr:uncharacterized protein LOC110789001 [Spinacia oleracea]KNA03345.1 hypothetical protein SOVF_210110 isoform A [Spinacia oleracea]
MEAQQQQQYQYQYQPQTTETLTPQAYDSSTQIQSYDHSNQAYYAAYQQQQYASNPYQEQQQQDYSSYYYPDYSTSYHQMDPNSIHPPGVVPVSADSQQTHLQNTQNVYYPHGVVASQPPPSLPPQGYLPAGGSQASRSLRGRGTFGRHGRGRGGGRGKPRSSTQSVAEGQAGPSKPPLRMAWCEVCRTDCTTLEVLEQHKNGKRHKRNLKVHEELQNLSRHLTVQDHKLPVSQPTPETVPIPPQKAEALVPPNENSALVPAASENKGEAAALKDTAEKSRTSGALPSQESVRNDHFGGRGGLKRRMRGGRGGKWMRAFDGSRRAVEPPKPKQVVPLICNLCNVKCESQVVFESHIAGKKHLSNVKRFQGHKEVLGEGIQALYPTIANLPSSTSIIPQANQQGPHDAQALASMMLSQQNLQDPQAAHAALTQLLHQHGIHDAQTLITQLVPYMLAQTPQLPGVLVPAPAAGFGVDNQQNSLSQVAHHSVGAESHNVTVENNVEQQNVTSNVEPEAVVGIQEKPADVPLENEGQQ